MIKQAAKNRRKTAGFYFCLWIFLPECGAQSPDYRQGKQSHKEIAYTVYGIKREPGYYPGDHSLEAQSEHQSLHRRIKRSEQEPVQSTYYHVHRDSLPRRHILRQQHDRRPKQCPQVGIGYPPETESGIYALNKDINVYRIQCLCAENNRIRRDKHRQHMNIREKFKRKLCCEHQSAQKGEYADLPYRKLSPFQP